MGERSCVLKCVIFSTLVIAKKKPGISPKARFSVLEGNGEKIRGFDFRELKFKTFFCHLLCVHVLVKVFSWM